MYTVSSELFYDESLRECSLFWSYRFCSRNKESQKHYSWSWTWETQMETWPHPGFTLSILSLHFATQIYPSCPCFPFEWLHVKHVRFCLWKRSCWSRGRTVSKSKGWSRLQIFFAWSASICFLMLRYMLPWVIQCKCVCIQITYMLRGMFFLENKRRIWSQIESYNSLFKKGTLETHSLWSKTCKKTLYVIRKKRKVQVKDIMWFKLIAKQIPDTNSSI